MLKFISTSAGGYEVWLDGHLIGHVAKSGKLWHAKLGEFNLGEHRTRKEAGEAMVEVYEQ